MTANPPKPEDDTVIVATSCDGDIGTGRPQAPADH